MPTPRKTLLSRDDAMAQVLAVYAELEQRPVERHCTLRTECCQFKLTGEVPYLTGGEALVAAHAFRALGQTKLPAKNDGSCPLLDSQTGRCQVYAARPFGCRTHFCSAAGGPYKRREVVDLIRRLEDIDTALGGAGSRNLPVALKDALDALHQKTGVRNIQVKAAPRSRGR
jgi:Fe-S-cluster containining protein